MTCDAIRPGIEGFALVWNVEWIGPIVRNSFRWFRRRFFSLFPLLANCRLNRRGASGSIRRDFLEIFTRKGVPCLGRERESQTRDTN